MSSQSPIEDETDPTSEQQPSDREEQPTEKPDRQSTETLVETKPTVRPTLVWMAITVALAAVIGGYVATNQSAFGGPETTRVVLQVVGVVALLSLIRLTIKLFVLTRTTYRITSDSITREYTLLLRTRQQQVPSGMVRSTELRQSRVQKLLGYGTMEINRGLGGITLENVPQPAEVRDALTAITEGQSRSSV
jgi:uncharacterized membrane protein YdbT with pleckstrin-like domain